jgi:phosphohistidine phosphatase
MPPTEIYLVRHAIAAERGPEWPDDGKRPLTVDGIARFKAVVAGLRALAVDIDIVVTSPLVRARQTADLLSSGLPSRPPVRAMDALSPGFAPQDVLIQLARATRRRRVALVGHEPGLGELAAHLVGAARPLPFRKGAVCRIDVQSLTGDRAGTLVWFMPPKALRRIGDRRGRSS